MSGLYAYDKKRGRMDFGDEIFMIEEEGVSTDKGLQKDDVWKKSLDDFFAPRPNLEENHL